MASSTAVSIENNSTKNGSTDMEVQLKERAERNRQRALLLKKSKVVTHPYTRYQNITELLYHSIMESFFFNNKLVKDFI